MITANVTYSTTVFGARNEKFKIRRDSPFEQKMRMTGERLTGATLDEIIAHITFENGRVQILMQSNGENSFDIHVYADSEVLSSDREDFYAS